MQNMIEISRSRVTTGPRFIHSYILCDVIWPSCENKNIETEKIKKSKEASSESGEKCSLS